ncbi:hypothetical protein DSM104299_02522 [Baekduia alba]|uniref:hypothetical protein n=1 Tax=Baekduia alba TaxID=2997333 RepID=UPI00234260E6|nr:hypothetical protein [Baekduia alba]WCB93805.1 hypothetical protein DSM104299_02522 [Baekduia alba]
MNLRLAPVGVALVAGLAVPAGASAVPHWSAPAVVIPSPGPSTGPAATSVPQVGIGGGRSVLAAGSGNRALLARGSAANVFASPVAVADSGGAPVGTDTAVGGDGSVVVGWAAGGVGHVTVVAPSGAIVGTADLPGAGVNAIGVGLASDGSAVVAYRTKASASSYSLHVATAPAGSAAFVDAGTLESAAPTDSIDVAGGPGGAVAVAYRKLASKYRATVAVRAAGASAFEASQVLGGGDQDDQSPQVAFDADGTVVAAWGNPAGALWATRGVGATSFSAPAALGAGAAFSVDLESTPGGGTAVAVAGDGSVRAGVQPFASLAQAGPSFTSQFSGLAAVTTSPAGVTSAVWVNPTDGAVHAVDLGGADQVIGYGSKDTVTPVGVASSADRTVAVWTDQDGAVSAATRSESAVPASPGSLGPKPSGRDASAPKVKYVSVTKRLRVTTKTKTIKFKIKCSEACKYLLTGSLRTQLSSKARRSIAPLPPVTTTKVRSGVQTVTVKFGTLARRDLTKALKKHHGGQLFLVLEASDATGNGGRTRIQLTLQPKPVKHHR